MKEKTRVAYSVDLAKPKNNKLSIYLRLHIMLIKALHNDKAEERTKWKKPQDNENCLNPNKNHPLNDTGDILRVIFFGKDTIINQWSLFSGWRGGEIKGLEVKDVGRIMLDWNFWIFFELFRNFLTIFMKLYHAY